MSSSDRVRGEPGAARRETPANGNGTTASPPSTAADPYASWLDRMQRARTRHAAITRNLYTWSNYKSWADRVKDSWGEDEGGKEKEKG